MDIRTRSRTPLEVAAERLRAIVLSSPKGALIGSEDLLVDKLGCSRSTVRQVARLLEREGLLRVKRGINGGYFGARPDAGTIEATVSAYLETLPMEARDITVLASALWVEAVRKAATRPAAEIVPVVDELRKQVVKIKADATFDTIRTLELEMQEAIFALASSAYIKLIFDINTAFSRRRFPDPVTDDASNEHKTFVQKWKTTRLLELEALELRDTALAVNAAQLGRRVWHERLKSRFAMLTAQQTGIGEGAG
jgi:DNA-binding GntR family transcriptional regulator